MPAARRTAPLADFEAIARWDTEAALFSALLRAFKDVRSDGTPTRFVARCPVVPWHRLVIEQTAGGSLLTCEACKRSPARNARLGAALARLLGYERR